VGNAEGKHGRTGKRSTVWVIMGRVIQKRKRRKRRSWGALVQVLVLSTLGVLWEAMRTPGGVENGDFENGDFACTTKD